MTDLIPFGLLVAFALLVRRRASATALSTGLWTLAFGASVFACLWERTGAPRYSVLVLATLLAIPGPLRPRPRLPAPAFLNGHGAVVLAGLLSAAAVAFVWGSSRPVPVIHDEAAYLLQAQIFASGRWIAPARPLPEFFEQMHVFVTPFLAGKYPPGHSLLLVPGVWLGWPALVPVLLNGLAGALLFAHARRLAGGAVALVCWLIWVTNPGTFPHRASYLSENTTTVLWLLSLWSLREWLEKGGRRWVALLALCLGWGAITRPMTAFALALPIAFVFLRRVAARRSWGDVAVAIAIGAACLAIVPVWRVRTTGDWRTSPYRLYSRVYYPYEWPGFGVRPEPPLRPMPKSMDAFERQFKRVHAEHRVEALPAVFLSRIWVIGRDQWAYGRRLLGVFAIAGALDLAAAGVFAVVSSLALVIGYLYFAHPASWSPYYLEIQTVLSFVTALGLCGVLASLVALGSPGGATSASSLSGRRSSVAFALLVAALFPAALVQLVHARGTRRIELSYQTRFRDRVERLPPRSIVFVRYAPAHNVHRSLVTNEPDLASARAWIVHDLGDHDADLARLAPDSRLYLYDDERGSFLPLSPQR